MQVMAEKVFASYTDKTRVESFRRLTHNYRKYFRCKTVTSSAFMDGRTTELAGGPVTRSVADRDVEIRSEEGMLFYYGIHLVLTRDYAPVIAELGRVSDKESLFKLFGILFANIQFIRLTGHFEELRGHLLERIKRASSHRFALEEKAGGQPNPHVLDEIRLEVEQEVYFLFGLALFSFLDHKPQDEESFGELVLDRLFCGRSPEEWTRVPLNLLLFLGDERIVWTLSLLLYLAIPEFGRKKEIATELKKKLRYGLRTYGSHLDESVIDRHADVWTALDWKPRMAKRQLARVKLNFGSLLAEIGAYRLESRYTSIRFLHRELLSQPRGHSPIDGTLSLTLRRLRELVVDRASSVQAPPAARILFSEDDAVRKVLQPLLEDAMSVAGKLEEVAKSARRLFEFTSISREHSGPFRIEGERSEFEDMVRELGDIIERTRVQNVISRQDLNTADRLNDRIAGALWDSHSPLQLALLSYIVDLFEVLVAAMVEVNRQLRAEGLPDLYSGLIDEYSNQQGKWYVLIDRPLLREVLRNILLNVQHGIKLLSEEERRTIDGASFVSISLEEIPTDENGVEKKRRIRLTVRSRAPYRPPSSEEAFATTLVRQASEVEEYGGLGKSFLKVEPDGRSATKAVLQLRSRREVMARLQRSQENKLHE
jgi:hypothetical protein